MKSVPTYASFLPSALHGLRAMQGFRQVWRTAGAAVIVGAAASVFSCSEPSTDMPQPTNVAVDRYVIVQATGEVCVGVWDSETDQVHAWATINANDMVMMELDADQIEPIIRRTWGER